VLDITCREEQIILLPQRALFWPRRRTLIISDLHLGKGGVFRRAGLAVPTGSSQHDLTRLRELIACHQAERLVILGDFFHGLPRHDEPSWQAFWNFRRNHSALQMIVVPGNHDRSVRRLELDDALALQWFDEGLEDSPFLFRHKPGSDARGYVLAGHLHPVVTLTGSGMERLRVAVFWFRDQYAVMPAFGSFTGGLSIKPSSQDTLYGIGPNAVVTLRKG
jgi:DNA ligase-associated metallophosphoesterase